MLVLGLPRSGNGRQGAPVKGTLGGDDLVPPRPVLAGQLKGGLVGLGAAVAEKDLVPRRVLHQGPGQKSLGLRIVEVGGMNQAGNLLFHRRHHRRVAVPQDVHGQAADQVQVAAPPVIPHPGSFPLDQEQVLSRLAVVGVDDVVGLQFLYLHQQNHSP